MSSPAYPLKVSANGHYVVDQNSVPILLNGDGAWSLAVQCSTSDIDYYLASIAAQGRNCTLVNVIEHYFTDNAPNTIDNIAPFTGATWDATNHILTGSVFTTPNSTYFARVDHVVSSAANYGICVFLAPMYLGNGPDASNWQAGWAVEANNAATTDLQSFGTYLGTRYASSPNVVWVIGADCDPAHAGWWSMTSGGYNLTSKMEAFAAAIAAADPNHLITAHTHHDQEMGITPYVGQSWFTLNSIYCYDVVDTDPEYVNGQTAYTFNTPTMPFFLIESTYENEHSSTQVELRREKYWTILSGGTGFIHGCGGLWNFGNTRGGYTPDTPTTWQNALTFPGPANMQHLAQVMVPRNWYALVPDTAHTIATSGYGVLNQLNYVTAAQTADRRLFMAYLPQNTTLGVNMAAMASVSRARWYDPTNRTFTEVAGSPFVNSGTVNMQPAATNAAGDPDWVLVIEALDPGMSASWVNF